jgi:hypothetical protein
LRAIAIRECEEQLNLIVSWTSFLCSTVKKLNSKNSAEGLLYLSSQPDFAIILKQVLMLALDENKEGEQNQNYARCLAILGS